LDELHDSGSNNDLDLRIMKMEKVNERDGTASSSEKKISKVK